MRPCVSLRVPVRPCASLCVPCVSFVRPDTVRCEHPRHACRTNTPGEGLVPCYRACHEHPRRLRCTGLRREEYFERIIGMMGTIGGA